ncbi:MAG: hypothetical protein AAF368_00180 [Planctomycetota bacterium]
MVINHLRTQHAVGQGGFHAAILHADEAEPPFRYVYDCGALPKYAHARTREIDAFLEDKSEIDILFLSHIHADHVNGVKRLLAPSGGVRAKTIMLPNLHVAERLMAYGEGLSDGSARRDAFVRDMAIDPVEALGRFEPDEIVFVDRGGVGGAPGAGGEPIEPAPVDGRPRDRTWKLVGTGHENPVREAGPDGPAVLVIPDTAGVMTRAGGDGWSWLLLPYIDEMVAAKREAFLADLAGRLGLTVETLRTNLKGAAYVRSLVLEHAGDLQKAYEVSGKDINKTSMSLYSGPGQVVDAKHDAYAHAEMWTSFGGPVAWLATGDAMLKQVSRRTRFFEHFGRNLKTVKTFMVPHHGASSCFHNDLAMATSADTFVVAADRYGRWRHPAEIVMLAVANAGHRLRIVNSNDASRLIERVQIP